MRPDGASDRKPLSLREREGPAASGGRVRVGPLASISDGLPLDRDRFKLLLARHCEELSDEAIHRVASRWIASLRSQ